MGGNLSHQALTQHKKYLSILCGTTSRHISDSFWSQFAQFPTQLSSLDPKEVQKILEPYCRQLVVNSRKTGNLQTLLLRVIGVVRNAENPEEQLAAANGLCFLKFVFKSLLEKLHGHEFLSFIEQQSFVDHHRKDGLLVNFVKCLVEKLVEDNVNGYGYLISLEAILCLLVGCSTQLYVEFVSWSFGTHPFMEILMNEGLHAPQLLQNLISWYVKCQIQPPGIKIYKRPTEESPSVYRFVRRAAATVLWLPVTAFKYFVGSEQSVRFSPLADASQYLFFVLVHHVPFRSSSSNPYRRALMSLHDVAYMGGIESEKCYEMHIPSISFSELYEHLAQGLEDERGTLMLYTMLQCVDPFRDYATVRSDLYTMMLPLLKQSYHVSFSSQSQLYLISIIILILSQDMSFCQEVHKVEINGPEWFQERMLGKISLGSFISVLLLRTAHKNLVTCRDQYLQTNTMAALANVTLFACDLDSYAAQKFLGLVEMVNKKYQKLYLEAEEQLEQDPFESRLQFYRDFLHMMLEILNGTIFMKPVNNPTLIYAVLQRQDLFNEMYTISPDFRELTENMQMLVQYFNATIDEARRQEPEGAWNVNKVLGLVRSASQMWRTSQSQKNPDLRFSYEEEDSADQFFVPVVWTLILSFSDMGWNTETVSLFTPQTPTASAMDSDVTFQELQTSLSNGIPDTNPAKLI